ncbi:nitrilase-related carbon-nitrogen hydrolase [Streptomyces catenulae]|uniref:D-alanyl-D-alanine dipeptidase n=1 Tax=Streptomyces catenulae TaxID=66875 RepID=A0ABV2YX66_9ACTN|nr:nitrilase-related carbon-nitrogen hydrolase [Streptomyces catenulae]
MLIAAAQFPSRRHDIAANATRMAALLARAADLGVALVVFAELALTQYDLDAFAADPDLALTPDDARLAPVREACRAHGVAAVVNLPAREPGVTTGIPGITSFVFGPDGALLTRYTKLHLSGREGDLFTPGRAEGRFRLGGVHFALATCYDNSFPELAEHAAADGCRVYLASSFHCSPESLTKYPQRARDNGLHVLLANGAGTGSGASGPGCGLSGAWLPDGRRVASAGPGADCPDEGELVLADVRDAVVLMADPAVAAVPVRECGEPLVDVREAAPGLLAPGAGQTADGAAAHLRSGVLERLLTAERALPDGLRLRLAEGYRPPALQRRYFEEYADTLRKEHPDRSAEQVRSAASRYVSPPEIAPHAAGGAADLILTTADGTPVDMGTRLNASPEESDGACYTAAPGIPAAARRARRTLGATLTAAGLVNYPTEWWHWSYGDRYWALETGADAALYGPKELA